MVMCKSIFAYLATQPNPLITSKILREIFTAQVAICSRIHVNETLNKGAKYIINSSLMT